MPFTLWTELALHIWPTPERQSPDQLRQFQQIISAEQRAACRDRDIWIHRDYVSPPSRQPSELLIFVVEVDPILTPCVLVRNQFKLAAVPRVERVSDPKSSVRTVGLRCSCQRRPTDSLKASTDAYGTNV